MGEAKAREEAIAKAMTGEVCGNCKFALDEGPNVITCRRYPPQCLPVTMAIRADPKAGGGTNEVTAVAAHFPQMQKTGYCGEWKTRLILN